MKSVTPVGIPDELVCFDPALGVEAFNSFMLRPATPDVTEVQDDLELNEHPVAPVSE